MARWYAPHPPVGVTEHIVTESATHPTSVFSPSTSSKEAACMRATPPIEAFFQVHCKPVFHFVASFQTTPLLTEDPNTAACPLVCW